MSDQMSTDRDLLERAEDALHSFSLRMIGASPYLTKPFTDRPDLSPWTHTVAPQARRAHDLAMEIRKHLGLPHRWATTGMGSRPVEIEAVIAEAVAAERERIRQLARERGAIYISDGHSHPFADLLREDEQNSTEEGENDEV